MNDVPRRLRQYPHELSGGMRQRAMIAMALACEPALLIADEPTTALDVSVQAQILALLRQLVAERGMALAVVTHDMGVIAALADDVVVMRQGRIVEHGPVARILAAPEHEYTRALLAATPRVDTPGAGTAPAPAVAAAKPLAIRDLQVHHRLRTRVVARIARAARGRRRVARSRRRRGAGHRRRIRLWQVDAGARAAAAGPGHRRRDRVAGPRHPGPRRRGAARLAQRHADRVPGSVREPRSDHERGGNRRRAAARAAPGHERRRAQRRRCRPCWRASGSARNTPRAAAASSPADSASAWRSRAPWSSSPNYWCATKRSARSTCRSRRRCWTLLEAIKRERGTSIVFVSHNLAVVRRLCERVLVMYLGRVVEDGPTEEVFRRPRHPYTRMLLESVPLLDPARERARLASRRCRGKPRRRSIGRADARSARAVRRRYPHAPSVVQSRKRSRNRTRWPACGGAKSLSGSAN